MYFLEIPQTFKCIDLHCLKQKTVTQSDKGLAKIAEGASLRRHAETSPVKVKDTHLINNKLPPAEILYGECSNPCGDWILSGYFTSEMPVRGPVSSLSHLTKVHPMMQVSMSCVSGLAHILVSGQSATRVLTSYTVIGCFGPGYIFFFLPQVLDCRNSW